MSWTPDQTRPPALSEGHLETLKHELMGLNTAAPHFAQPSGGGRVEVRPLESPRARIEGRDWPIEGYTMMGKIRLDSLEACVEAVLANDVPGDLIETGVWRGGGTILMRKLLDLHGETDRRVWVADSFAGQPPPNPELYPADEGLAGHTYDFIAVPLHEVRANFERFGVLNEQVRFLEGFFSDTLPTLGGCTWSVIRLDGDMYESTIVALESLYPNLSPGGYVIVDDYAAFEECHRAVHDFREANGITDPIEAIDWVGAFWRKGAGEPLPGRPGTDLEYALARRARMFEELYTVGLNRANDDASTLARVNEELQATREIARERRRGLRRALKRLGRAREALRHGGHRRRSPIGRLAGRLPAKVRDPTGAASATLRHIEAAENALREAPSPEGAGRMGEQRA